MFLVRRETYTPPGKCIVHSQKAKINMYVFPYGAIPSQPWELYIGFLDGVEMNKYIYIYRHIVFNLCDFEQVYRSSKKQTQN